MQQVLNPQVSMGHLVQPTGCSCAEQATGQNTTGKQQHSWITGSTHNGWIDHTTANFLTLGQPCSPSWVVCLEHVTHRVVLLGKHVVQQLQATSQVQVEPNLWQRCAYAFYSTVQYSNCGRGSQTLALASEPRAHEGANILKASEDNSQATMCGVCGETH